MANRQTTEISNSQKTSQQKSQPETESQKQNVDSNSNQEPTIIEGGSSED